MENREKVLEKIKKLAQSPVNDAIRLAFIGEDEMELIKGLDLSAVKEIKRSGDGAVELKFIDRVETLKWLAEHMESPQADQLYRALEKSAKREKGES
ncbi:XRE family transcriptional regulator [Vermiculatibacterium agrestimuris]|uniref:XRE family transcriptional regulator n=1 Tax=Vermiculatibacterium agrestimuris TaxID=2941519 RepID=UPI00203B8A9B|nr:XRE family transcriptional regulator [Vermiculatibacterium agrestimuris]